MYNLYFIDIIYFQNEMFRQRLEAYGYSFRPGEGPESSAEQPTPSEPAPEQPAAESPQKDALPVDDGSVSKTISSLGETTKRNLSLLAFRFLHGVDEMTPLKDGKHAEFDFDDVYDKDESQTLDESSRDFRAQSGKFTSTG